MLVALLFWLMTLAACGYAAVLGGWEGRWTTALILSASAITLVSEQFIRHHWGTTNGIMFAVDIALFLGMYVIAAKSKRWWPLWVAAFQLNSVAAHIATVVSPEFSAAIYNGFEGLWAFPGQIIMVFGIWRDRYWTPRRSDDEPTGPAPVKTSRRGTRTSPAR